MTTIRMPHEDGFLSAEIPDHLLGELVAPNQLPACGNIAEMVREQLSHPIESLPLEAAAHPGQKVAVIIDDISRPTPTADLLPPVISRLLSGGIQSKDISIVIALGSHRPMTKREIITKTGKEIAENYNIVNIPCQRKEEMRSLGMTQNGVPVEVNQWVADADLRIGIGAIGPHMDTGFSGGGKIVLPGVCSCTTVNEFHSRSADVPGNQLGNAEAPARLLLESFVKEQVPLDFIVNVILHPGGGVYKCVAGHFITAQRKGVQYAMELFGVKVKKKYPLIIVNSYPFEIDFWQCTKAFWSGELMASPNGLVVMVSPCPEGTATHPLWAEYLKWPPRELKELFRTGDASDPNACAFAVMFNQLRKNVRFGVVTPTIPSKSIEEMGLESFDTIEQAVTRTISPEKSNAVAVITHGGITLPLAGR